jgi:hypothetical protein
MAQWKQLLKPKNSITSSNVDRNKHELYFRFPAFNKKGGKGKQDKKKGGTQQDIATRKNEEL